MCAAAYSGHGVPVGSPASVIDFVVDRTAASNRSSAGQELFRSIIKCQTGSAGDRNVGEICLADRKRLLSGRSTIVISGLCDRCIDPIRSGICRLIGIICSVFSSTVVIGHSSVAGILADRRRTCGIPVCPAVHGDGRGEAGSSYRNSYSRILCSAVVVTVSGSCCPDSECICTHRCICSDSELCTVK